MGAISSPLPHYSYPMDFYALRHYTRFFLGNIECQFGNAAIGLTNVLGRNMEKRSAPEALALSIVPTPRIALHRIVWALAK